MTTVHLLGSDGFIGRSIQRVLPPHINLHCWSHNSPDPDHYFDLFDRSSWQSLLQSNPSHVVLLSWPGLPHYHDLSHITHTLPSCIELIEQLKISGLKRLVVAGTCYEYGLLNGSLRETDPTSPVNAYAIAKDALRKLISSHYSINDFSWCWLRIFFPYGPGQNQRCLLPSLQLAIEQGQSTFPLSSGRQLRDFVPVEEIARQLLLLAVDSRARGVYNGGSGSPRSVREIVESRVHELNAEITLDIGFYPDRLDEPFAFWADMSRMNSLIQ